MEPAIAYEVASAVVLDPAVVRTLWKSAKVRLESRPVWKVLCSQVRPRSMGLCRLSDWRFCDRSRARQLPRFRYREGQRRLRRPPDRACVGVRSGAELGWQELTLLETSVPRLAKDQQPAGGRARSMPKEWSLHL